MNKLFSYKCPKCSQTQDFTIEADCPVTFTIDGEGTVYDEEISNNVWTSSDIMQCGDCGHEAKVKKFQVEMVTGLPMVIER